jgi:hypothetical protein
VNSWQLYAALCVCTFSGKRVISFHQSLIAVWDPLCKFRTSGLVLGVASFLGYMLSQPPFPFCSLSPHPLGVPGAHLWPSPRLQAPFPASHQPGGGLLPTHMHCAPGNAVSTPSGGLARAWGRRLGRGGSLDWCYS